jgi:SAM-dependent methyltransferase
MMSSAEQATAAVQDPAAPGNRAGQGACPYLSLATCDPGRVERARSFGLVAEEYERGRPGYPLTAIRWLLGEEPVDVVDLGAGTGKLTAALVAAGHRVVAVEPVEEMRAILTERVLGARVVEATAEDTSLAAGGADAVVAGAAFHWFDRGRVFPEIARILRRPGTLGLLGNSFDPSVAWVQRLRSILGGSRLGRPGHWPEPEELSQWFSDTDEARFPHEQPVDRERLLDLAVSRSSVATLPPDERQDLLARISGLWDEEPELRGHESVSLRYLTRVRRARGLRAAP